MTASVPQGRTVPRLRDGSIDFDSCRRQAHREHDAYLGRLRADAGARLKVAAQGSRRSLLPFAAGVCVAALAFWAAMPAAVRTVEAASGPSVYELNRDAPRDLPRFQAEAF